MVLEGFGSKATLKKIVVAGRDRRTPWDTGRLKHDPLKAKTSTDIGRKQQISAGIGEHRRAIYITYSCKNLPKVETKIDDKSIKTRPGALRFWSPFSILGFPLGVPNSSFL